MGMCMCEGCGGHGALVARREAEMNEKRTRFEAWYAEREARRTQERAKSEQALATCAASAR